MPHPWTPTRKAGLDALEHYSGQMGRAYADGRNFDLGWQDQTTSRLSPWLRHRLVTEEEVLRVAAMQGGYEACEKFVQEVFWRGYFKGWLEQRPFIWQRYLDALDSAQIELSKDRTLRHRYTAAVEGRTGIECFDHWAQELEQGGWLHNHARMWMASIWIFTLNLPWALGADWFLRHLVDGDPASNTLSWRWVAGLHTRGKTYLADPDNIRRFTKGQFHPAGQLSDVAQMPDEPETGPALPLPKHEPVRRDKVGWLMLTEDLAGGYGDGPVLALPPLSERGHGATGKVATQFEQAALADAAERYSAVKTTDWSVEAVRDWMSQNSLQELAVYQVPQGPQNDRFLKLERALGDQDVTLIRVRRSYDDAVWPHARKGFFALKKQIPAILDALAI
ncbi:FAD-binding domain-containing protein [Pontivivens insulae]|uniref:Deoxyribodipyrimidine photo-lyase n=1 Tax=Pontivivens insulae TaxID=1639689 RepID=A0A2R8ACY2_9RHOB|nr:FAD-binding domain-containing protein [Pontivivens insulae]RED13861.1 deoxyribodipyrimidine photo-lyase [Pontivivens insulae]SPF29935.1 Deoxyribodipyrimidine photo-lyase [Pontivivens insulae]